MKIGIDLGGTKIEGIALGPGDETLLRRRTATPRNDYAATLEAVAGLVRNFEGELDQTGTVGIGIPGAISPATGLVKNANSVWLIGKPLAEDLKRLLGREVRIANDANCFALSEAHDGAGADREVVFGVIVGTGTGGGIVVRREALAGPNSIAGEWGHNPLPWPSAEEWPGPQCYCGRTGCIETFLSGPGLTRDYRSATGIEASPEDIVRCAKAGEEAAETSLLRYEDRMARALAGVLNVLDPDIVVLGGGMSNLERLYENIPRRWGRYIFSDCVSTPLVRPVHGDSSGVRGAARLW